MASTLAIKADVDDKKPRDIFWPLPPDELLKPNAKEKILNGLRTKVRRDPDDDVPVVAADLYPMAYEVLKTTIELWGYKLNNNFWIFPYDWRQSNEISARLLMKFIKHEIEPRGWQDVDVINHSMGGFLTRYAQKHGASIKRGIYITSPHFGSPLAYFALHPGMHTQAFSEFFDLPHIEITISVNLRRRMNNFSTTDFYAELKEIFRKFPSMYELLPDDFYLKNKPMLIANNRPLHTAENTYLTNEWAIEEEEMIAHVKKAMKFKTQELGKQLPGATDNILNICGTNVPTKDMIKYQKIPGITHDGGTFTLPFDSGQRGDSWVPITSAMGSISETAAQKLIDGGTHLSLPNDVRTLSKIKVFLTKG
jgi:Lecithin:cholesterol acyltransferase